MANTGTYLDYNEDGKPIRRQGLTVTVGPSDALRPVFTGNDGLIDPSLITLDGSDKNYLHIQSAASDVWDITHNLGKYPAVSAKDSAGNEVKGAVEFVSANRLIINFIASFSGEASLN